MKAKLKNTISPTWKPNFNFDEDINKILVSIFSVKSLDHYA